MRIKKVEGCNSNSCCNGTFRAHFLSGRGAVAGGVSGATYYTFVSTNKNFGFWDDNVTGYTIRNIEDALVGRRTWDGWRINIENSFDNATEEYLEDLFIDWS